MTKAPPNRPHRERIALQELIDHRELVIKPAAKGGAVVIMDQEKYRNEIYRQLNDREECRKVEGDSQKHINTGYT